jgi:hypothetical protein
MQDEGISGVKILLTEEMKRKQDKVSDPDWIFGACTNSLCIVAWPWSLTPHKVNHLYDEAGTIGQTRCKI